MHTATLTRCRWTLITVVAAALMAAAWIIAQAQPAGAEHQECSELPYPPWAQCVPGYHPPEPIVVPPDVLPPEQPVDVIGPVVIVSCTIQPPCPGDESGGGDDPVDDPVDDPIDDPVDDAADDPVDDPIDDPADAGDPPPPCDPYDPNQPCYNPCLSYPYCQPPPPPPPPPAPSPPASGTAPVPSLVCRDDTSGALEAIAAWTPHTDTAQRRTQYRIAWSLGRGSNAVVRTRDVGPTSPPPTRTTITTASDGLAAGDQATATVQVRAAARTRTSATNAYGTTYSQWSPWSAWSAWSPASHRVGPDGEPFTDTNGNGRRDNGEPFTDTNSNGVRDAGETYTDLGNGRWNPGESYTDAPDGTWNPGESFTDSNGNGIWDSGEAYVDVGNGRYDFGETFVDAGDGVYNPPEPYTDSNSNGRWDPATGCPTPTGTPQVSSPLCREPTDIPAYYPPGHVSAGQFTGVCYPPGHQCLPPPDGTGAADVLCLPRGS